MALNKRLGGGLDDLWVKKWGNCSFPQSTNILSRTISEKDGGAGCTFKDKNEVEETQDLNALPMCRV